MNERPSSSASSQTDRLLELARMYWPLALIAVLFVLSQWPTFKNWWTIWDEKESYYSHGPIVPFIAGFMVWCNRRLLAKATIKPCLWGLLLLGLAAPVHFIATLMELRVLYMVTFYGILFGCILLIFGWRIFKILFVPMAFMITMIPVANWALDASTGRAQLVSAAVAEHFLSWSGYDVIRYGSSIDSNSFIHQLPHPLLVGTPCSGLRLLISLITFSWFFTYVIEAARWKKVFLILLSLPLAVFINALRITMIGYAGFWTGSGEAMNTFHDYSGYIGLVVCFVLLFGIAKLIRVGDFRFSSSEPIELDEDSSWRKPINFGWHITAVVVVLGALSLSSNAIEPLYNLPHGKLPRENIPVAFGNWNSEKIPIEKIVRDTLGSGDLMNRIYTDSDTGRSVQVFLDASMDLMAFHDPHLCLPGGGSPISKDRMVTIKFDKPTPITIKATVLHAEGNYGTSLVLYWYMRGDQCYPRTENLGTARRYNTIHDLKTIVTKPWELPRLRHQVKTRQYIWYRFVTDMQGDDSSDIPFMKKFVTEFIANHPGFGTPAKS
ncbi:MAG: exosortase/archaeosortase family protein [Armatimonadota bacterium]|nr:exosortase [bacterium]